MNVRVHTFQTKLLCMIVQLIPFVSRFVVRQTEILCLQGRGMLYIFFDVGAAALKLLYPTHTCMRHFDSQTFLYLARGDDTHDDDLARGDIMLT